MPEPLASDVEKTVVADQPTMASPDARFKLIRCLGSGGMGDVHLAEDSKLRRMVAIKTIRADLCKNDEICKRIERECLLHAKIGSHPHIVTLFDRIEHGSQINLVMEYVEGETLQDLLTKGRADAASGERRLSWKDGINIAVQTLEALGRIHAHGIVHRDIKPSNIIVTRDDGGAYCAKLMDFGIARMQADDEQSTMLTKDGTGGPGTPTYMAPEQIDPKTFGPVSTATDVYAMGVMLYQILSGRPPFVGSLTEVFNGHLNRQPPAIDFHGDSTVPAEIKEILECALAKRPSQRFPSVKVFREELLRVSQGRLAGAAVGGGEDTNRTMLASSAVAVAAGPEGHGATLLDTSGTRPRASISTGKLVGVIAVLLLAAAAVAAYFVFSGGKSEEGAEPGENAPQDVQPAPENAPAPDGSSTGPAATPATPPTPAPNVAPTPAGVVAPSTPPPVPGTPQPPAGIPPAAITPPVAVPTLPTAAPSAPAVPATPADSRPKTSALDALEKRVNEQPAAPAAPVTTTPTAPPTPEPPAATEPPKPKPPAPKPADKAPASDAVKPVEPQTPSTGGWKVIENKDRKVN